MPVILPAESRTLVENVRWETYVALSDDRRGAVPRMTYDRGAMELMSPRKEHEKIKTLLGRLVAVFAEVRGIEIESVASTTFRREDLDRGFEADESYYIEHANAIRAKEEIDLAIDPPPDLVIEVEITSSAIRKLDLFAAIGVAEVWRHDGNKLRLFHLQAGDYKEMGTSAVLPGFPVAAAQSVLSERRRRGEIALVREFRSNIEDQRLKTED